MEDGIKRKVPDMHMFAMVILVLIDAYYSNLGRQAIIIKNIGYMEWMKVIIWNHLCLEIQ